MYKALLVLALPLLCYGLTENERLQFANRAGSCTDPRDSSKIHRHSSLVRITGHVNNTEDQSNPQTEYERQVGGKKDYYVIETNGYPHHPVGTECYSNSSLGRIDPQTYYIPRMTVPPPKNSTTYCVGLIAGIAKNGVPIFNAYNVHTFPIGNNAKSESWKFDYCQGHLSKINRPGGNEDEFINIYHYHYLSGCLLNRTTDRRDGSSREMPDEFIGVALDGYPIYGPLVGALNRWPIDELDECHGHDFNDGLGYRYIANTMFPYVIGCFKGQPIYVQTETSPCQSTHTKKHLCLCTRDGSKFLDRPKDAPNDEGRNPNQGQSINDPNQVANIQSAQTLSYNEAQYVKKQMVMLLHKDISFWKSTLTVKEKENELPQILAWLAKKIKSLEEEANMVLSLYVMDHEKSKMNDDNAINNAANNAPARDIM